MINYGKGPSWHQGACVAFGREVSDYARPVWPFIEIGRFHDGARAPTVGEMLSQVWSSLANGAQGIQYFDGAASIRVTTPGPMHDAIVDVNAKIHELAPVFNDHFANGYVSTDQDESMWVMAKYHYSAFFIVAIPRAEGSRTVTFALAGAPTTTADVLWENRTVQVTSGTFTDNFPDPYTPHVYQIGEVDPSSVLYDNRRKRELSRPAISINATKGMVAIRAQRSELFESIAVYTIDGRFVRDIRMQNNEARWDCRNNAGQRLTAGRYVLRLEARDGLKAHKVVSIW
jgi:hypothetical protein